MPIHRQIPGNRSSPFGQFDRFPSLKLASSFRVLHQRVKNLLHAVRSLGYVPIDQNFNAIVLVVIRKSVRNISLHPSHHLLEPACHTLLPVFNYTSNVAVRACVLLAQPVPVV